MEIFFAAIYSFHSVKKTGNYLPKYFNKDFIGLSIKDNRIKELVKKTGVYVKKVSSTGSIDFYDHTGAVFLVNKDSKIMGLYTPPIKDNLIISDLKRMIN